MRKFIFIATVVAALAFTAAASAGKCPPQPPVVQPPPAPAAPQCQPGYGPYGGKDGDESEPYHNQACCPDFDANQRCDDVVRPGQTTVNTARWHYFLR